MKVLGVDLLFGRDFKKIYILEGLLKSNNLRTLIETGTYYGDTLWYLRKKINNLYSIELSRDLFRLARIRFFFNKNVHLYQGNSERVLAKILKSINDPVLFWLDAHYSAGVTSHIGKESVIVKELEIIKKYFIRGSVIAIDDAHLFVGNNGYPTEKRLVFSLREIDKKFTIRKIDNIFLAA